jgi:two-component system, cell cycle sensor histidine kinase and response regulator CckA
MANHEHFWWKYGRALAVPVLLWGLVVASLWEPVRVWLNAGRGHDKADLREWINEARGNLPDMAEKYWDLSVQHARLKRENRKAEADQVEVRLFNQREMILEFFDDLTVPINLEYPGQLPLFPTIYRIEIAFEDEQAKSIVKEWNQPTNRSQYEELVQDLGPHSRAVLHYQLHAYARQQKREANRANRVRLLGLLAIIATGLAIAWVVYVQRGERERRQARQQVDQAERLLLQEEVRRQEAERLQQETERDLLQQRLAAQAYEQKMLELKSQLYASIGIMAGSYAHNIKNLLVRPNDLLRRCLEGDGLPPEQTHMLREVRQTLGTVTERLQQILSTVRRDPNQSEMAPLEVGGMLRGLEATWSDLARDKWKLQLGLDVRGEPLWIEGDLSHLQQAVENLLFNARDATFEMRNHLRDEARRADLDAAGRRAALIAAAGWKGSVEVRAWREGEEVVLEVRDNGIGMSEEVRRRCTETHFSTKRDNAIYEGNNTGMGLGLSFVVVILEHHKAKMEIESAPQQGALFRVSFPLAE